MTDPIQQPQLPKSPLQTSEWTNLVIGHGGELVGEMAEAVLGMDEIIDPVLRSTTSGLRLATLAAKLRAIGDPCANGHDWREAGPNGWEKCFTCKKHGKDGEVIA